MVSFEKKIDFPAKTTVELGKNVFLLLDLHFKVDLYNFENYKFSDNFRFLKKLFNTEKLALVLAIVINQQKAERQKNLNKFFRKKKIFVFFQPFGQQIRIVSS